MEKYSQKIKEWFSKLIRRDGSFDPERDWKIIFVSFVLLFLLSVLFNGYIFWSVKEGNIFNGEAETKKTADLVDEKRLDATLQYFEGREARLETIQSSGVGSVDPSL